MMDFFIKYNLILFTYYVAVMKINCRRKLLTLIKIYYLNLVFNKKKKKCNIFHHNENSILSQYLLFSVSIFNTKANISPLYFIGLHNIYKIN